MAAERVVLGRAPERGILGLNMASDSVILRECDIPGSSLDGRRPSSLKNEKIFVLR